LLSRAAVSAGEESRTGDRSQETDALDDR
jgi:hypothetical protein